MIFRFLQTRAQAAGGSLTSAELDAARVQFLGSFANAFGFFDSVNQRCMEASAASAPTPFGPDAILASLLALCGSKPARAACAMQVARFGPAWMTQFFGGVADYVRNCICPTADQRLLKVYAAAALKFGARLTVADLMQEDAAQRVVRECLAPLIAADAPDLLAAPLSDAVSLHIAAKRGLPKPDVSKVTEQEMRSFLTWLPPQVVLALAATPEPQAAVA